MTPPSGLMGKAGVVAVKGGGSALKVRRSEVPLRASAGTGPRTAGRDLLPASGDPIFLAPAGRLHDSRLEERFASEFRRSAPGWDILREPLRAPRCHFPISCCRTA